MITLYHCPETRSMRSLWQLHEIGAKFKLVEMPFDLSITRSTSYLSVHPLGRVPALVNGDLTLFESGAITEYLCETFPESQLGRPMGHPERYMWLQWIHYSETIAVHAASVIQQLHFISPHERSPIVQKLESIRLNKAISVLETQLKNREYLLGLDFSAADVCVAYSIHLALRLIDVAKYPNVSRYYRTTSSRPAFQASLPNGWTHPLMWLTEDTTPLAQK